MSGKFTLIFIVFFVFVATVLLLENERAEHLKTANRAMEAYRVSANVYKGQAELLREICPYVRDQEAYRKCDALQTLTYKASVAIKESSGEGR